MATQKYTDALYDDYLSAVLTNLLADASHTPSTQAFGDLPAVGVSVQSARSDHGHGMPSFGTGTYNTFFGYEAGLVHTTGSNNSFFGSQAGYLNNGSGSVFLGNYAGYYETGSNKLFIDNQDRSSEADARVKALIYGIFDTAVANQSLAFNVGWLGFYGVPPVVRASTISALSLSGVYATDYAGIQVAVNAIITALQNLGLTS